MNDVNEQADRPEDELPIVPEQRVTVNEVMKGLQNIKEEAGKLLVGQEHNIELMLTALIAGGHVLLEGVPGIAKTLTARVLSTAIDADFVRIQFTPDMMPSDIIGTSIFDMKRSEFEFVKGPIFSNVVLIDEINRAPAKTQSALFEVMEEKQISYDGIKYEMGFPFIVIATQNPVEQEGTYRLPEAQLDRFLMRIKLGYPTIDQEVSILEKFRNHVGPADISTVKKVLDPENLRKMITEVNQVHIDDKMLHYIAEIIQETRQNAKIYLGGSPRASLALMRCAKATAMFAGRDFIIPDDIQFLATHILNHRLILTPDADMEGLSSEEIIAEIIEQIEVPR